MGEGVSYDPRTYWEERARANGETYVAKGNAREHFEREYMEFDPVLRALIPPAGRLLDFGCGSGRFTMLLSNLSSDYFGVDVSSSGIALARKRYPYHTFNELGSSMSLLYDCFDVVVCVFVLQHMVADDDYQYWCAEFGRVLRPGGCIVAIDRDPFDGDSPLAHMLPRGPDAFAKATGFVKDVQMRPNADHWAARFVKP